MHWLGLKATTMQSDNFQTVFARSTAAKKGFRGWQNTFMEMCPFLLLQGLWWSLALTSTLGSQLIAAKSQVLQWGTRKVRNQPWETIADFPQHSLSHYHSCMIAKPAKTDHSHNPGVTSIQESLASVFGRLLGPCMFPCCHNQCCVLDRSLALVSSLYRRHGCYHSPTLSPRVLI